MTLKDLKNLTPSGASLREHTLDPFYSYYFVCDNKQVCVTKVGSKYNVCTFNCSLIRVNYPVDSWQIDGSYSDIIYARHQFRCLVLKLIPFGTYKESKSDEL